MKLVALLVFSFAVPVSLATEASGSFVIHVKGTQKSTSCNAVFLATPKSEKCFAVTARECLNEAKAEGGTTSFHSAELGDKTAEYFPTPGEAALLAWKCGGREKNLPSFTLSDYWTEKKIGRETSVKYGKWAAGKLPSQAYAGEVGEIQLAQTVIKTPSHPFEKKDLGEPLLCRTDMGSGPVGGETGEALCGVLVSADDSRFATGDAMSFIRTKLKSLGVPEPKIVSVEGRRVILED